MFFQDILMKLSPLLGACHGCLFPLNWPYNSFILYSVTLFASILARTIKIPFTSLPAQTLLWLSLGYRSCLCLLRAHFHLWYPPTRFLPEPDSHLQSPTWRSSVEHHRGDLRRANVELWPQPAVCYLECVHMQAMQSRHFLCVLLWIPSLLLTNASLHAWYLLLRGGKEESLNRGWKLRRQCDDWGQILTELEVMKPIK